MDVKLASEIMIREERVEAGQVALVQVSGEIGQLATSTHRCRRAPPRRPTRCRSPAPPPANENIPSAPDQSLGRPSRTPPPERRFSPLFVASNHNFLRRSVPKLIRYRIVVNLDRMRASRAVWKPAIVPLLCSRERGGHFLVAVWPSRRKAGWAVPTPTFSETFSSFNECVRSLWVRNLSIIEPRLAQIVSTALTRAAAPGRSPVSR